MAWPTCPQMRPSSGGLHPSMRAPNLWRGCVLTQRVAHASGARTEARGQLLVGLADERRLQRRGAASARRAAREREPCWRRARRPVGWSHQAPLPASMSALSVHFSAAGAFDGVGPLRKHRLVRVSGGSTGGSSTAWCPCRGTWGCGGRCRRSWP
jgi:hypothetical protein